MYSYQHRYHAGNFADIHKHLTLISCIHYLKKKPTPFTVIDLFAGEGMYELNTLEAAKNKEYNTGFSKLTLQNNLPELSQQLINIAKSLNANFEVYPGSPAIIQHNLRENDRGIFVENHPQASKILENNFHNMNNIHVHKRDSYEALNALLPPKEKRGIVFIDPSYEVKLEYKNIKQAVINAHKKFSNGIYFVWFPVLNEAYHKPILQLQKHFENTLISYFKPDRNIQKGMLESGILIINPPWTLKQNLTLEFESLANVVFTELSYSFS